MPSRFAPAEGSGPPPPPIAVRPPLRRRHKVSYGIGNIAYSLPYQASATFFIFFATAILKIPPGVAGVAIAASSIWDAVMDPLIGFASDHTRSRRWGSRHPYLLAGGLLLAVLTFLTWSVSPETSRYWVLLWLILLKSALAVYYIPYLALGGDLTTDYGERSVIQGIRAAFYLTGMILAIAGATFLFFRSTPEYPRGQLNPSAYPRMGAAFAVVILVAMAICVLGTRGSVPKAPAGEAPRAGASKGRWGRDLAEALRNRDLVLLLAMIFILEAGFQFGIAIGIHVNTYTYGLSGPRIGLLSMVVLGVSVLSQPFWVWFTKRYEKRTALIAGIGIGFVGFIGAPWAHVWWKIFPIQAPSLPWTLGLFMVAAGLGNGAFMSVPNSMISDAADVEELRTGRRDEGLYFGLYTFAYKLGVMISLLLSGFALTIIGFDARLPVQSEATRFALAMVPTYLLIATAPFALWCIARYGITRARWTQVRAALEHRAAPRESYPAPPVRPGSQPTGSGFHDLS